MILVTGATGTVGRTLVRHLAECGAAFKAMVRKATPIPLAFQHPDQQEVFMAQAQSLTPLRQRMLDDMRLRNMAAGTRRTYVRSVARFSVCHSRSPDQLA